MNFLNFAIWIPVFSAAGKKFSAEREELFTPLPPAVSSLSPVDVGDGNVFKLKVTQDVFLENASNKNNQKFLIVGKHPGWNKKRSLIQFQSISSYHCPVTKVRWAKMYVYFEYAHKWSSQTIHDAPYTSRPVQVHRVKKKWKEAEATSNQRLNGVNWGSQWLDCNNNVDAEAIPQEPPTTIYARRPKGFVEFDITRAVKRWIQYGNNNGLLLRATDDNVDGRDLRFFSNYENDAKKHAFVNVMCDY